MSDEPYADPSVSSLSLDQSNQIGFCKWQNNTRSGFTLMAKWAASCWILEMPKSCVYFASWGKSTTGTILPSTNCIWLKAK